jgi:hypothetical protein
MAVRTSKTVDFLPMRNIFGEVKKITEHDIVAQNTRIIPIVTILCMEKGTSMLYPDMGARELLLSIPYQEMDKIYELLDLITIQLRQYTGFNVTATVDEEHTDLVHDQDVAVRIDVEGVIEPLTLDVNAQGYLDIRHPSLFR